MPGVPLQQVCRRGHGSSRYNYNINTFKASVSLAKPRLKCVKGTQEVLCRSFLGSVATLFSHPIGQTHTRTQGAPRRVTVRRQTKRSLQWWPPIYCQIICTTDNNKLICSYSRFILADSTIVALSVPKFDLYFNHSSLRSPIQQRSLNTLNLKKAKRCVASALTLLMVCILVSWHVKDVR